MLHDTLASSPARTSRPAQMKGASSSLPKLAFRLGSWRKRMLRPSIFEARAKQLWIDAWQEQVAVSEDRSP
eukprot:5326830-Pyramimonas_sp.AAC.1